ncbi:hypothetical protein BKA58DRAFT_395778 [Alternaria rosae]|uniref:uncharacterized protein n=1 Tax=Alternaria rosae TaxID=1187941 RepID=UPI001E8DEA70|nr:uncharacterized protein BKA58DRAFT_395778 [Alternaria rosae]KAH6881347.1 hypothetical protein BKA58DRAFT_395778 [Alternaria rosae]
MPPKRRANDADDDSKKSPNERWPGLRDRSKLKTTARNDDTAQPSSSPINNSTASNAIQQDNAQTEAESTAAPINKIQEEIEKKQKSLQYKLQKAREAAEDKGQQDNADKRSRAHLKRRDATLAYEDYLYYQTPEYRKQYREDVDAAVKERAKLAFSQGHAPAKLTGDETYDNKLRSDLRAFEENGVGMLQNMNWRSMPPDQLRMRIPRAKNFSVGLGELFGMTQVPMEPYNLLLDTDAIEKKRREVEDRNNDPDMSESHSERRARELGLSERPPTDGHVNDALSTARDLRRTRLESGLFISAGETWADWNNSDEREAPNDLYDQLTIDETPDDGDDSSDDENDLFAISYRECSGLAGFPRAGEGVGGGGSGEDNEGDDGGDGNKRNKKDTNDPVAPANVARGPPIGPKARPKATNKNTEKHDYTQYNRVQLRTALKYREQAQSAKLIGELHRRAGEYDEKKAPDAIHHYILEDRKAANKLLLKITGMGAEWWTAYKEALDEQKHQAGESGREQEASSEGLDEHNTETDQTGEQVSADISEEDSPESNGKDKSKKPFKSTKKKQATRPKRKSKK